MTNQEAITVIQTYIDVTSEAQAEALDLAVEALEATQQQFDLLRSIAEALGGAAEE